MLSEEGLEGSQALGGLNVADDADNHHRWGLNDGDRLDDLLLVELCRTEERLDGVTLVKAEHR